MNKRKIYIYINILNRLRISQSSVQPVNLRFKQVFCDFYRVIDIF